MTLAYGADEVRQRLRIDFLRAMFYGLSVALLAGLVGLIFGIAFQHAFSWSTFIRGIGRIEFSTPLLFDIGVYIVVFSATSAIVMSLAEEGEREDH
jgi:multicomponent Na+:H+ antiporter subunit B